VGYQSVPIVGPGRDGVGMLIMPLRIYSYDGGLTGNFDVFVAYDVSSFGISERFNILHVASNQFYGCFYKAYLQERSFVCNGNVTTMKGHSVVSTDLNTAVKCWTLDMPNQETQIDWSTKTLREMFTCASYPIVSKDLQRLLLIYKNQSRIPSDLARTGTKVPHFVGERCALYSVLFWSFLEGSVENDNAQ
jgi:hypothetical protein